MLEIHSTNLNQQIYWITFLKHINADCLLANDGVLCMLAKKETTMVV